MSDRHFIEYGSIEAETDQAFQFRFNEEEVWIPKSQCYVDKANKEVELPEWLMDKIGLYY